MDESVCGKCSEEERSRTSIVWRCGKQAISNIAKPAIENILLDYPGLTGRSKGS